MTRLVHHLWQGLRFENARGLRPVFDTEHPIRSTGDMLPWYTGRPWEDTVHSHINRCVYDSTSEASEAARLERHAEVAAWANVHMWAYAEHYGIDELVSEDFEHGRLYGTVRAVNPFR